MVSSLGVYVGGRQLLTSWLLFYYLRPVVGSLLAVAVYLLLRMGVTGLSGAPSTFNVFGLLTFALLSGMFSRQAIDKLAEVFDTLFHKIRDEVSQKPLSGLVGYANDDDVSRRLPMHLPPARDSYAEVELVPDGDARSGSSMAAS